MEAGAGTVKGAVRRASADFYRLSVTKAHQRPTDNIVAVHAVIRNALESNRAEVDLDAAMTDSDLADIRATLEGDDRAYSGIVSRYQAQVFTQMWRFTRDRVEQEELVQEVFIEVFKSLGKFKGEAPLLHWIRRIATRVGYRFWERGARERRLRTAILREEAGPPDPPEDLSPSEAAERLHDLMARLVPRERLILTLIYFEECSIQEVADRMGWSATRARVEAHRARMKLKTILEKEGLGRNDHE
jgi:RNA polymerase sigma-70 factor (ECF subfamily)